jgi:ABC-type nitrate/sulfonate/bicarbonate transport system ATPase subunit
VVVLVGIPGCGKSTLSAAVTGSAAGHNWRVANQDALGNRQRCEAVAMQHLLDPLEAGSVIIDRCNFDWR